MVAIVEEIITMSEIRGNETTSKIMKEIYNSGLNDAWELARKICGATNGEYDNFSTEELCAIFGICGGAYIINENTYQEALAKLEAYEKEQAEIKVGDVVEVNGYKFLVTTVANDHINLIDSNGITTWTTSTCKKTGKHIDIQPILEQIGE
jgi:hypothetical protein